MDSFKFFKFYNAVNLHMRKGSTYDFFTYGGNTKVSESGFKVRKDKYFFEKFSKFMTDDIAVEFIFYNFLAGQKHISSFNKETYLDFLATKESLEYNYQNFLERYKSSFENDVKKFYEFVLKNKDNKKLYLEFIVMDIVLDGMLQRVLENELLNEDEKFLWMEVFKEDFLKVRAFIQNLWITKEIKKKLLTATLQHFDLYK